VAGYLAHKLAEFERMQQIASMNILSVVHRGSGRWRCGSSGGAPLDMEGFASTSQAQIGQDKG